MRLALALIVKGTDEEAKLLDRCLKSVAPYVDGIFITRTTLPGEEKNERVAKITYKYKGILSDFEWCHDFAAARNFNFQQVPKDFDYIMWTDADDIWRGLSKLKATMAEHPHMDAFGFEYLYDWDEFNRPTVVHYKTMIVRNDGCVSWIGEIHEDFQEHRRIDVFMIKGIDRLHLTTPERGTANAKRNLEISSKQVEKNPDDPRSYWNLANSCLGVADYEGAQSAFLKFLEDTQSEDEKYLAHCRIGECYRFLENRSEAIKSLQIAIGLKPELPDAYFQLASMYFGYGDINKAEEYNMQGLLRRPQPDRMIMYNPRDYDYNPLMMMARIYYELNRPHDMLTCLEGCLKVYPNDEHLKNLVAEGKEQKDNYAATLEKIKELQEIKDDTELKKAIDALPVEIRSHPAVCAIRNSKFVKTESSGNDLAIYCGNTTHEWNPQLFREKGFGGSEEAVIHLAQEWAKMGWRVTVYNNCGYKESKEYIMTNALYTKGQMMPITYRPFWEWNYRDKQDVTILWRWTKPLDADINSTKIFIDLHDVIPSGEFNEKRLKKVDKIFVKTQFHRSLFPNVSDNKIVVIPNGFEGYLDPAIEKDPMLVINTSSPDRSMDVLPKLWKRVKERVPAAKLLWAYGWNTFDDANKSNRKMMEWKAQAIKEMDEAGIEQLGKLTQADVGRLYQKASFLAYPSAFAEIFCISVLKAQAVGCLPVTTDFAAFDEINKFGVKTHTGTTKDTWAKPYAFHFGITDEKEQNEWVDAMVTALENSKVLEMSKVNEWIADFKWSEVAKSWNEIFLV